MPIFSYTYMTRQSIKQVEVPLDLEPFRIDNPSKLGDWEAREILTMTASEPNVSKSVNFSLNSERIDMTLETSGTISDSQTKGAISLMDLKFPFFQLENQVLGNGQTRPRRQPRRVSAHPIRRYDARTSTSGRKRQPSPSHPPSICSLPRSRTRSVTSTTPSYSNGRSASAPTPFPSW